MPIFNHPDKGRVLFVHIPKTAGSSVEQWLRDAGFTLEKINHWSGHNHQHATREVYEGWGDFDYKFAIVRHPLDRFVSALGFRTIHAGDADNHAKNTIKQYHKGILPVGWGNHMQPQVDFISDDVEIFKFEENFFPKLSKIFDIPGPYPHVNKTKTTVQPSHLSDEVKRHVRIIYDEDYKTFGYEDGLWEVVPPRES